MMKRLRKPLILIISLAALGMAMAASVVIFINPGRPGAACLMCHKMRDSYQSWRVSTHKDVRCNKCHFEAPSGFTMIIRNFSGAGADVKYTAVTVGCRNCHENVSDVVAIENLRFPHDNHQDVQDCETCHLSVTHGTSMDYSFQQSRKMCYSCHESKEVNPHGENWLNSHGVKVRESTKECQACHSYIDCKDCHGVLQQHKEDWYDGHRRISRESDQTCRVCHDESFCSSCHDGFTLHERGWLKNHKDDDTAKNRDGCTNCHTENYCLGCHDNDHRLHHSGNWLSNHGAEINTKGDGPADLESCVDCHQPGFCLSCHRGLNTRIHSENYEKMHTNVSSDSLPACMKCHTEDSCGKCHSQKLPSSHESSEEWMKSHGMDAIRNMNSCLTCHKQDFCESCHSKRLPESHLKPAWGSSHGDGSRRKDSNCSLCHEEKYCNTCHRRSRPPDHYMKTWRSTHGQTAMFDMSGCFACHVNTDCRKCHDTTNSHKAAGWMLKHTGAENDFKTCDQCHSLSSCIDCHKETVTRGHNDCTLCHSDMKKLSATIPDACRKCHAETVSDGLHNTHTDMECTACHQPHNWTAGFNNCTLCHADIKDEHFKGVPCDKCHHFN